MCSVKLSWDTSSCHSGGHDLSRSQRVIVWWCIYRHQASGSGDVLIWLIGGDVRAQPPITQAAAIKIVTVITPSQSENGQISLTQSHHGKVPHTSHHTSPAHLCSPGSPPTLKAKHLKAWHFMVLDYILHTCRRYILLRKRTGYDENYSSCCDLWNWWCLQNLPWN